MSMLNKYYNSQNIQNKKYFLLKLKDAISDNFHETLSQSH